MRMNYPLINDITVVAGHYNRMAESENGYSSGRANSTANRIIRLPH
jgi:hypothetical protein